MKKIIFIIALILSLFSVSSSVFAAPNYTITDSLIPRINNGADLGSTTMSRIWRTVFSNNFYREGTSDGCATWSSNFLTSTGIACGSGGGGGTDVNWAYFNAGANPGGLRTATSGVPVVIGATATSSQSKLQVTGGATFDLSTTTNATSTNQFNTNLRYTNASGTNATSTNLTVTSLSSALALSSANGLLANYTGTSCTNQFPRSISAAGVATCATVVAADVSLANLTATNSTLTFSGTYNGSTARTIGLNLGNANTWTALQTFNAGTIANQSTTTNATTTTFAITGLNSTFLAVNQNGSVIATTSPQPAGNYITALTGDGTASGPGSVALTLATVNGNVGSFGGSTAIPNFTVNAKGLITAAGTNAVVAPAGTLTGTTLASGVVTSSITTANLSALTATDSTLTFSGSYNGNTARTVGINLSNANTWTGQATFNSGLIATRSTTTSATTTNFAITGLSNTVLAVDANGSVVATTTGSGGGGSSVATTTRVFYAASTTLAVETNVGDTLTIWAKGDSNCGGDCAFLNINGFNVDKVNNSSFTNVPYAMEYSTTSTTTLNTITITGTVGNNNKIVAFVHSTTTGAVGTGTIDTGTAGQIPYYPGSGSVLTPTSTISVSNQVFSVNGNPVFATTSKSFNLASTTLDAYGKSPNTGTTTIPLMYNDAPVTMTGFYCQASTTGAARVRFGDGSNWTQDASCSTTGSFNAVSTNNTFTAFEPFVVQASSTASNIQRLIITVFFKNTP